MSRWLSSVNNILEKLDDQVENVRDVLVDQYDDGEYTDEDGEEEEDDDEEEEIDLMAGAEKLKAALFGVLPAKESSEEETDEEEPPASPVQEPPLLQQDPLSTTPAPKALEEKQPQPPPEQERQPAPPQAPPLKTDSPKESSPESKAQGDVKDVAKQTAQLPTVPKHSPPPPPPAANPAAPNEKVANSAPQPPAKRSQEKTIPAPPAPPKLAAPPKGPTPVQQQPQKPKQPPPVAKSPSSGINTNNKQQVLAELDRLRKLVASLEQGLTTSNNEKKQKEQEFSNLVQSKQQLLAEMKPMRKQIVTLQQELNAANKEIKAQEKELNNAATIVERERQELKEEKEDMLEDHEEEMENLKAQYEEKIANLKAKHKQQLDDMKQQLSQEKAERQQEGGDLSHDLEDALKRERDALQELSNFRQNKAALESKVEQLNMQQEALQEKLETALQSQAAATERQLQAETALDEALEQHKRQLKQRQLREAELERTIAEMGAALTTSSSANTHGATAANMNNTQSDEMVAYYKEQWELATDELETLKGQLRLEMQRCETLRQELDEINQERAQETAANQERQREFIRKLEEQASTISRLESTVRDSQPDPESATSDDEVTSVAVQRLQRQLEESKEQAIRLSEQLLRQQGMTDVHKSEILALKGRLKAAIARAEEAEKTTFHSSAMSSDSGAEGGGALYGGYKMKRRVKGRAGGVGGRSVAVRSISRALNIGPGTSMEGLGKTIDALDSWMIDTGSILRLEPLARLGFLLYFVILHLWCFCLVAFHAEMGSSAVTGPSSLRGAAISAASSGK